MNKQEKIKELRREIRETRAKMKEHGVKRISCFNPISGDAYRLNAKMFQLETELKSLLQESKKL